MSGLSKEELKLMGKEQKKGGYIWQLMTHLSCRKLNFSNYFKYPAFG